jgi:hypothetical protein
MNCLRSLYSWLIFGKDIRLASICGPQYRELLNTKIRRLVVDDRIVRSLNIYADIYGKLDCEICTIAIDPSKESDLPLINYESRTISLSFVNTKIIDVCNKSQVNVNPYRRGGELVKFGIDVEAEVYVGCEPISESQSIVLTRLDNGGILDPNDELITIFKTMDLIDLH